MNTVWLCDLTHTYQVVAMKNTPLAVGFIAAYLKDKHKEIEVKIFKYPKEISDSILRSQAPLMVGFSNYLWNQALNIEMARIIKEIYPAAPIVFGGPAFPLDNQERRSYLAQRPFIDFFVPFEGEKALSALLGSFLNNDFNIDKTRSTNLKQVVWLNEEYLYEGEPYERLNLEDLPSPYLSGQFDKYEDQLVPMVQTTRGCPFSCQYCYDGLPHWNKIRHRPIEVLREELIYIAQHYNRSFPLYITDANFGMYANDIEFCKIIAEMQDKYGWPWLISLNTGKRNKERILECSNLTRGALPVSVALQSSDPDVLKNVQRTNFSLDDISWLVKMSKEKNPRVLITSDLILGLPGDTLRSHLKSIRDVAELGVDVINDYQFMLLPGTPLNSHDMRIKYGFKSSYRVMPRCFGKYDIAGKDLAIAEIEEVSPTNNALSFEDYVYCREFILTVNVVFNDFLLSDLFWFIRNLGQPIFDLLVALHDKFRCSKMKEVYEAFSKETAQEQWSSWEDLNKFLHQPGTIEKCRDGELGANLLSKYKNRMYQRYMSEIINFVYELAESQLENMIVPLTDSSVKELLTDLKKIHLFIGEDFLNPELEFQTEVSSNAIEVLFARKPLCNISKKKCIIKVSHTLEQRQRLSALVREYGNTEIGIGMLLWQIPLRNLLRQPVVSY